MASPETFDIPIGKVVGRKGDTGNGIKSIELLSTSGLSKTYRITMTDDTTFDFVVTDGNGISGASFDPETNELTITFDNGTSFTTPSLQGAPGDPGTPGDDGYSPAVTIETITGGHRVTITDKTHPTGQSFDVLDGEDGASDAGEVTYDKTAAYNDGTVGKAVSDLEDTVSTTQIINTASGAIASFSDGADGMPIRKLVANIEPVQDLHGYDHPWPAGGGINLFPLDLTAIKAISRAGTWDGNSYTENGITITFNVDDGGNIESILLNGTATSPISFAIANNYKLPIDLYYPRCEQAAGVNFAVQMRTDESADIIAVTCQGYDSSYSYRGLVDGLVWIYIRNGLALNNFVIHPMLVKEANYTAGMTYSPYSNECPISGHTGAEIQQTGKNLYPHESLGVYSWGFAQQYALSDAVNPIFLKANTAYTLSIDAGNKLFRMRFWDASGILIGRDDEPSWPAIISGESIGLTYYDNYKFYSYSNPNPATNVCVITPKVDTWMDMVTQSTASTQNQLELGSTATDYEPYTGNQISVNWEDEAGTVYGGEDDVVSGKLSKIYEKYVLPKTGWGNPADGVFRLNIPTLPLRSIKICNAYPVSDSLRVESAPDMSIWNMGYAYSTNNVVIKDSRFTDAASFMAWMDANAVEVIYKLATPVEYTHEGQTLNTLYGTNNIWSNTGTTEVNYTADTKLYIDGKLAELQATILENIGG